MNRCKQCKTSMCKSCMAKLPKLSQCHSCGKEKLTAFFYNEHTCVLCYKNGAETSPLVKKKQTGIALLAITRIGTKVVGNYYVNQKKHRHTIKCGSELKAIKMVETLNKNNRIEL